MDIIIEVINKDLTLAKQAVNEDNFKLIDITGNRIMSNLLIAERKELMVLGYIIKEIGSDLIFVKNNRKSEIDDGKIYAIEAIESLLSLLSKKIFSKDIWKTYFDYTEKITPYMSMENEALAYEDKILDFTIKSKNMLIDHLKDNKSLLLHENNGILLGISNEIIRIINLYGLDNDSLVFFLLIKSLYTYYAVLVNSMIKNNILEINGNIIKEKIYPFVERIISLFEETPNEEFLEKSTNILADLGERTRYHFLDYLIFTQVVKEDKKPLIPKESKAKIGEILERTIENEIKK